MGSEHRPRLGVARDGVVAKYAHAKLDGHWTEVLIDPTEVGPRFITSRPTDITAQIPDRIYRQVKEALPRGLRPYRAFAELWVPNKPASCVKTALKEQWSTLQLTFFGLHGELDASWFFDHEPEVWGQHIEIMPLDVLAKFFTERGLEFAPFEQFGPVPRELGESELELLRGRSRQAGIEGWVLKTGNLTGWHKLKNENTIDLVITGVKDGKGKYIGQIGSLICSVYAGEKLVEVAAVSGMSDDVRTDITDQYDTREALVIGKVIEVEYQRMDSQGRLRHPRFVQFREDKRPIECKVDQDPDLAQFYDRSSRFTETEPEKYMRMQ